VQQLSVTSIQLLKFDKILKDNSLSICHKLETLVAKITFTLKNINAEIYKNSIVLGKHKTINIFLSVS